MLQQGIRGSGTLHHVVARYARVSPLADALSLLARAEKQAAVIAAMR